MTGAPLKGITVEYGRLAEGFFETIGWDGETMTPGSDSPDDLGDMGETTGKPIN
jgi:hypothetical protein